MPEKKASGFESRNGLSCLAATFQPRSGRKKYSNFVAVSIKLLKAFNYQYDRTKLWH